jgi:hypothetical protein
MAGSPKVYVTDLLYSSAEILICSPSQLIFKFNPHEYLGSTLSDTKESIPDELVYPLITSDERVECFLASLIHSLGWGISPLSPVHYAEGV